MSRKIAALWSLAEGTYTELKNLIVWAKDNGGMGTFYRSRHELIFAYKNGTAAHVNTFELGQHPDDILIDMSTGKANVVGPMTHEDKADWEQLAKMRDLARAEIAMSEAELETTKVKARRATLRKAIRSMSAKLETIVDAIGEWPTHHADYAHRVPASARASRIRLTTKPRVGESKFSR